MARRAADFHSSSECQNDMNHMLVTAYELNLERNARTQMASAYRAGYSGD